MFLNCLPQPRWPLPRHDHGVSVKRCCKRTSGRVCHQWLMPAIDGSIWTMYGQADCTQVNQLGYNQHCHILHVAIVAASKNHCILLAGTASPVRRTQWLRRRVFPINTDYIDGGIKQFSNSSSMTDLCLNIGLLGRNHELDNEEIQRNAITLIFI